MTIMFQYKGKAYAFSCIDEVLLDMEHALTKIDEGHCPAMPMTPQEVTDYLVERKRQRNISDVNPIDGVPN